MRSTSRASGKNKEGKGTYSDKKNNLSTIKNQVDMAEEKDLPEEEATLQEDG